PDRPRGQSESLHRRGDLRRDPAPRGDVVVEAHRGDQQGPGGADLPRRRSRRGRRSVPDRAGADGGSEAGEVGALKRNGVLLHYFLKERWIMQDIGQLTVLLLLASFALERLIAGAGFLL